MSEQSDRPPGPHEPENLACWLMTWLDPAEPDECHLVVDLMKKMIEITTQSYAARQRDLE
jgi:hypothetical protein